jgi:energy-coupling factor transporter ATP-binding protein EcfA2
MSKFPYAGLRPFQSDETAIFFGREQHTDELLARLSQQQFLAVVGYSGSGKSSLVKAGLIPSLHAGFLGKAGTYWQIAQMRPGNEPFTNLADALIDENTLGESYRIALLQNEFLKHGAFSLHELLAIKPLAHNGKLLIVCDQFEEIFRYQNAEANSEAAAFVDLLLASAKPYPLPNGEISNSIYVVLTMRSDFIGDCALFSGLAEAINNGLYLTPRLTREQLRAAIEEPALVFEGKVEPDLVVKLLEDAENNPDQLPLLQHALMRLWTNSADKTLTLNDYSSKLGDLKQALSDHADYIFNELTPEQKVITEILFKSLTQRGNDQRDTRRPVKLAEVATLANVEWRKIATIVEAFRKEGRSFLLPALPRELSPNSILDISHESLIRQWKKLKDWTEQEAKAADIYKRLEEAAQSCKEKKHNYYRTPELENALDWYNKQQKQRNCVAWASRYGQDFQLAKDFLLESYDIEDKSEDPVYCNTTVKRRGAIYPYPYPGLTDEQVKNRSTSIKLIRKGKHNPFYKMQVVNGFGKITPNDNINIGAYLKPEDSSEDELDKVCQWEFVYDEKNVVNYENNYNKDGKFICAFVYLPQAKDDFSAEGKLSGLDCLYRNKSADDSAKAFYIGVDGYPTTQKNSKAEYVEFIYSDQGDEIEIRYFDRYRKPQAGPDKTYGQKNEFDENGLCTKTTTINALGIPMNGVDGYATLKVEYNALGSPVEITAFDATEQPALLEGGYHKSTLIYDDPGNLTEQAFFDVTGHPTVYKDGYHKFIIEYNDRGNLIRLRFFNITGQPAIGKDGFHKVNIEYDDRGNATEQAFYDITGQPTTAEYGYHKLSSKFNNRDKQVEWEVFDVTGQATVDKDGDHKFTCKYDDSGHLIEQEFIDITGRPAISKDGYHKFNVIYDDRGNSTEQAYFDITGQPAEGKDGYHKLTFKYDDRNNAIERCCFDKKGQPAVDENAIHKATAKYNDKGNIIELAYFDVAGQPAVDKDGDQLSTVKYDDRNNLIEQAFFDITGHSVVGEDGYHKCIIKYNDHGERCEIAYFDLTGKPAVDKDDIHKYIFKYDDEGNQKIEYFDTKDHAMSWINRKIHSIWRKVLPISSH